MKKNFTLLFISLFMLSCNDGDIIVTSFDFDDANLQICGGPDTYVFFKINNAAQESILLNVAAVDSMFLRQDTFSFTLDGSSNFVTYRKFDATVAADYFCQSVPPLTPLVVINYDGDSGVAILTTTPVSDSETIFDDNDGVPFIDSSEADMEGFGDYDGDGVPNYYDSDDDGDNVPTISELDTEDADGDGDPLTNPLDTDGDGIPNYLDPDDDGDGVLTRDEDSDDDDLNPTNDFNGSGDAANTPDYLNPDVAIETIQDTFILHSYTRNSSVNLVLTDLVLTNENETITQELIDMGGIESILNDTVTIRPDFVPN